MSSRAASCTATAPIRCRAARVTRSAIGMPTTGRVAQLDQDVDRPGVSHPRRVPEAPERRSVDDHWESSSFVVGHAANAQASAEVPESSGQSVVVVVGRVRHAVQVCGRPGGAVGPCRKAADHDVVHAVGLEGGQQPVGVEVEIFSRHAVWPCGGR